VARFVVFGLVGLLSACGSPDSPMVSARDQGNTVVIRGGWLFDGIRDARSRNSGIVIRDGRFAELGADLAGRSFPGAQVIELDDTSTILPGMFDLHAHYNLDLVDEGRVEEVSYNAVIFLANGVTATWTAGDFFPERVVAARDRIERGDAIGPRIFAAGPYFGAFRCEYQIETAADDCVGWPNDITEREMRAEVDRWADRGVTSIKIKQATPQEMAVVIDQAHKRGITAAGHLEDYQDKFDVEPKAAIEMGIDRIEHRMALEFEALEGPELEEMIALFLDKEVYFDANLQMHGGAWLRSVPGLDLVWLDEGRFFTPYARERLEKRSAASSDQSPEQSPGFRGSAADLKALYEAGGGHLLLVGTDEPVYELLLPGFAFHRELRAMVYAGLPPVAVLKAATINGARALGVADRLGSIEPGKLADLYVAAGNPLEDITAARNVRLVIKDGVIHQPQALLASAEGMIGPSGPDDHDAWRLEVSPLDRL
jgi:imidazolonepropionase-like amidohydrolase